MEQPTTATGTRAERMAAWLDKYGKALKEIEDRYSEERYALKNPGRSAHYRERQAFHNARNAVGNRRAAALKRLDRESDRWAREEFGLL